MNNYHSFEIEVKPKQMRESVDFSISQDLESGKSQGLAHPVQHITTTAIVLLNLLAIFGPVVVVLVFLYALDQIILTQLVYQALVLFLVPFVYLKLDVVRLNLQKIREENSRDLRRQVLIGIVLLCLSAIGLIGTYLFIYDINKDFVRFRFINIQQNFVSVSSFVVLMGFTNPILEEWFWRIFLQEANALYFEQQQPGAPSRTLELVKALTSLEFGFYHMFVVAYFSDWVKGFLFFLAISVAGRIFHWLRERFGILTSLLMHMGADFAVIVIAMLVVYKVQENKDLFLQHQSQHSFEK